MDSVENGTSKDAEHIANQVYFPKPIGKKKVFQKYTPNVEEIQDLKEQKTNAKQLDVAKSYILYRNIQTKKEREIFCKKNDFKPLNTLYCMSMCSTRHSY